jgi:hypothetical protein
VVAVPCIVGKIDLQAGLVCSVFTINEIQCSGQNVVSILVTKLLPCSTFGDDDVDFACPIALKMFICFKYRSPSCERERERESEHTAIFVVLCISLSRGYLVAQWLRHCATSR